MDKMNERLAGNKIIVFLTIFRIFPIPIDPQYHEKTTFTCPYGTFAYLRMPFGLCNAPGSGYQQKDRKPSQNDKTEHGMEKTVQNQGQIKDFSKNESECDLPVCDDFTTFSNPLFDSNDDFTSSDDESLSDEDVSMENFKIYSNPLFVNEEIISPKIDQHYFNAESNLIESLLNRDILIDSSPKIDYLLEEFSGELAHINPIPPGIEKADFDLEEEIRLVKNLLYDNSSPQQLRNEPENEPLITFSPKSDPLHHEFTVIHLLSHRKNSHTTIESLPTSTTLIENSDPNREEIDIFFGPDDSIPPGIESDFDSEEDIIDNLLNENPTRERLTFNIKPDALLINNVDELNEDECFDPEEGENNVEVDNSFTFVI
ncbi:hypothetical protein Tco_0110633 [Tanacetum coccineum]